VPAPKRPTPSGSGRFLISGNRGVEMPTLELGRRLASASDRLRAARRDGNFADICTWLAECDVLLDEYSAQASEEVWA
jgi:hypothetical protein